MALVYAARFPAKVRTLLLAGAPVDLRAAPSALSVLADVSPLALFQELVRIGDGVVPGRKVMKFWGTELVEAEDMWQVLQTGEAMGSAAFSRLEAQFRDWYAWTVDLPGTFFLEVVEKLYKRNELATGSFVALGQQIDLATVDGADLFAGSARRRVGGTAATVRGRASSGDPATQLAYGHRAGSTSGSLHGQDSP